MLWMPGFLLVLMLAVVVGSGAVVTAGVTLLLVAFWRIAAHAPEKI